VSTHRGKWGQLKNGRKIKKAKTCKKEQFSVFMLYFESNQVPDAVTWNALPDHIRTVADPVKFRKLLKSHYISQAFDIC